MALFRRKRRKAKRDLTVEEQLARGPMDLPFLGLVLLLTAIGLIALLSASFAYGMYNPYPYIQDTGGDPYYFFKHQAFFAVAGVGIMLWVSKVDYQRLRWLGAVGLAFSIFLLVLVLIPGLGVAANGARRWLKLGVTFQPSEMAKATVVIAFASALSRRKDRKGMPPRKFNRRTATGRFLEWADKFGFLELVPYGVVLLVILFLLYKEPHMSGMILVCVGAASVLFASGISLGWFVALGAIAGGGLWFIITQTKYMTKRIELWLDPLSDLQNGGYQLYQSQVAVGSGGLLGKGLGNSTQKYLYLPEMQNDFVFSIWCEEMGLIGAVLLIVIFALLIIRGFWLALHARDRFGTLLIVGFSSLTAAQVAFNIGVVTGAIPTTGISLPFFSYGGTALVVNLAEMGVILSVSRQITAPKSN